MGHRTVRDQRTVRQPVFLRARTWLKVDFFEDIRFAVAELHRSHHRAFLSVLEGYRIFSRVN